MGGKIEVYYEDGPKGGGAGGPRGVFGALNAAMVLAGSGQVEKAREIINAAAMAAAPEDPRSAEDIGKRLAYLVAEGFTVTLSRQQMIDTSKAFASSPSKETRAAFVKAVGDFFHAALMGAINGEPDCVVLWLAICGKVNDLDMGGFQRDVARFIERCPGHAVDAARQKAGKASWCEVLNMVFQQAFNEHKTAPVTEIVFPASATDDEVLARYEITADDIGNESMKFVRDDAHTILGVKFGRWIVSTAWLVRTFIRKNREADAAAMGGN